MFRHTARRFGGGDKSSFALKRRVIHPIYASPTAPMGMLKWTHTTDPMKISRKLVFRTTGEDRSVIDRLEGEQTRKEIMKSKDKDFDAFIEFLSGAGADSRISAKRFEQVYETLQENDETFIWLCMTSMAILNPGDVRSRLIYRHLEALLQAVASGEMTQRTAFRFYESAIRSPAYREIAKRQLERGASTRLPGLVAAAEIAQKQNLSRRPMSSYFELFQRITERSEALAPWGFPPLFQFEERLQLEPRLRFFKNALPLPERKPRMTTSPISSARIFWLPPSWVQCRRWAGPGWSHFDGVIPD